MDEEEIMLFIGLWSGLIAVSYTLIAILYSALSQYFGRVVLYGVGNPWVYEVASFLSTPLWLYIGWLPPTIIMLVYWFRC